MVSPAFMSKQTAAEKEQAALGDYEFMIEVDNRLGNPEDARDFIDADAVKLIGSPENRYGIDAMYQPKGYADAAETSSFMTEMGILDEGTTIEEDMVHLVRGRQNDGLILDTVAHEFLHRRDEQAGNKLDRAAHHRVYATLYDTARNEGEIETVVNSYSNFLRAITGADKNPPLDVTEEQLVEVVKLLPEEEEKPSRRGLLYEGT